jgi:hypothetical protein
MGSRCGSATCKADGIHCNRFCFLDTANHQQERSRYTSQGWRIPQRSACYLALFQSISDRISRSESTSSGATRKLTSFAKHHLLRRNAVTDVSEQRTASDFSVEKKAHWRYCIDIRPKRLQKIKKPLRLAKHPTETPTGCLWTPLPLHHFSFSLSLSLWLYSPCGPWRLFQFLNLYKVGRTPWTGDQPEARPLPTHRTTQT